MSESEPFETSSMISDKIIEAYLPSVIFDGWSLEGAQNSALEIGVDEAVFRAVYPMGLVDVLDGFAAWADSAMLQQLELIDAKDMRVRDRIYTAIMARFDVLGPYKEAVQQSLKFWLNPLNKPRAASILWRSSDMIWQWAGDMSVDYNRYTKRGLLSAVMGPAMIYWLNDHSDDHMKTQNFVRGRIENVLRAGQFAGKIKSIFSGYKDNKAV